MIMMSKFKADDFLYEEASNSSDSASDDEEDVFEGTSAARLPKSPKVVTWVDSGADLESSNEARCRELLQRSLSGENTAAELWELLQALGLQKFFRKQLRFIQFCPSRALKPEEISQLCKIVKRRYNMALTFLLDALNQLRMPNYTVSHNILFDYFNWTCARENTFCQRKRYLEARRAKLFAMILQTRFSRYFGCFEHASKLIMETIRRSHPRRDAVCIRMAMVETGALEIAACHSGIRQRFHTNTVDGDLVYTPGYLVTTTSPVDTPGLVREAGTVSVGLSTLITACQAYNFGVSLALHCQDSETMERNFDHCMKLDLPTNRSEQAVRFREVVIAARTTIRLSKANFLLLAEDLSSSSLIAPRPSKEPQGCSEAEMVVAINGVYALALDGKFSEALGQLSRIRKNNEEECKMYGHWSLCHACVQFDSYFFAGKIFVAERKCLERIHSHSPAEADFRRAIIAVWRGDADEEVLEAFDDRLDYLQELGDKMLRIRGLMVAALVQTDWDKAPTGARSVLVEALKLCDDTDLAYTRATVLRRLAVVDLLDGELSAAEKHLAACHYLLTNKNSYRFEKAMYHLTKFALIAMRKAKGPVAASSTEESTDLATARQLFEEGEFALLLKLASMLDQGFRQNGISMAVLMLLLT